MYKFVLLLLLPLTVMAGERAGNGGGVSENNLIYSWMNINTHLSRYLAADTRNISPAAIQFSKEILKRNPLELKAKLFFMTEKTKPFKGVMYLVTDKVGGEVYFNLDKLFKMVGTEKIAFSIADSMEIVLKLIKRDLVIGDSDFANLSQKFALSLNSSVQTYALQSLNRPNIQFVVLNDQQTPQVLLMDSDGLKNITSYVEKNLICDQGAGKLKSFSDIYMKQINRNDFSANEQDLYFKGKIKYTCGSVKASGMFTLRALYKLKSDKNVVIDINWMKSLQISAFFDVKESEINFEDIIFQ